MRRAAQASLRALAEDAANQEHAFVTHEDIRNISAFSADTIIAIKAPSGTTLEVPDPDEGMESGQRRYQIYLKSQTGPVEVFLVSPDASDGAASGEASTSAGAAPAEPSANGGAAGGAADSGDGSDAARRKRARTDEAGSSSAGAAAPAASPERGGKRSDPLLKLSPVAAAGDYWDVQPDAVGVSELFAGSTAEKPSGGGAAGGGSAGACAGDALHSPRGGGTASCLSGPLPSRHSAALYPLATGTGGVVKVAMD